MPSTDDRNTDSENNTVLRHNITSVLQQHLEQKIVEEITENTVLDNNKTGKETLVMKETMNSIQREETKDDSVPIPVISSESKNQFSENGLTEQLDRKIDHWKRELLDTGKRNKMINYRETKRATLKILEPDAEELFNRLAISEKTLTFQKPISKEYENMLEDNKRSTEQFLKEICGVSHVQFCIVDDFDLAGIIQTISNVIEEDLQLGHKVFFDLTGGESLPLVAFGILSKELSAPMHTYDVYTGQIHEYGYEGSPLMSELAEYDPIALNLDSFIKLYGGIINYRMHKDFKDNWNRDDVNDVVDMWNLSRKYKGKWVYYSALLRKFTPDNNLIVHTEAKKLLTELKKNPSAGNIGMFNQFLDTCEKLGFLYDVCHEDGVYHYRYKNASIKNYFWDGGSILEMYTFLKESNENNADDCRVGVHIDWDGVIHNVPGRDVLNEIDIMSMKDNLPTFISCKIGNVDQMALYELETVANRFGGKYAKKVLVIAKDMAPGHLLRAKEMGIEVRKISNASTEDLK